MGMCDRRVRRFVTIPATTNAPASAKPAASATNAPDHPVHAACIPTNGEIATSPPPRSPREHSRTADTKQSAAIPPAQMSTTDDPVEGDADAHNGTDAIDASLDAAIGTAWVSRSTSEKNTVHQAKTANTGSEIENIAAPTTTESSAATVHRPDRFRVAHTGPVCRRSSTVRRAATHAHHDTSTPRPPDTHDTRVV